MSQDKPKSIVPTMVTIPVIASFDTQGHLIPLYIRIHQTKLEVESYWLKPSTYREVLFCCKVNDGYREQIIDIHYNISQMTWSTPDYNLTSQLSDQSP